MQKILVALGLVAAMLLSTGLTRAAEDEKDKKEDKKGKILEKFKGLLDPAKMFEKMDTDNDGKVTKKEFKAFFEKIGKIGEKLAEFADTIFDKLDEDGDGKLTKKEFEKFSGLSGLKGKFKDKFKKKEEKKDE